MLWHVPEKQAPFGHLNWLGCPVLSAASLPFKGAQTRNALARARKTGTVRALGCWAGQAGCGVLSCARPPSPFKGTQQEML